MTILDTIKKKVNLQEETNAIQQILIQMYLKKKEHSQRFVDCKSVTNSRRIGYS